MESKKEVMHTPEPWFLGSNGNIWRRPEKDLYQFGGGIAGDKPIATTHRGWYGEDTAGYPVEANARRIVACVNACKHYSTEDLEEVGEHLSGVFAYTRGRCAELIAERDQAVRALKSAGYTLADGAKEWKPPVGPSVSPMLDRIDELIAQRDELLEALVDFRENACTPESVYRIAREAIAKCEVES